MNNQSYSKRIENAQVMLSGITEHKENLANRGINDQYIESFRTLTNQCVDLNSEQEKAKATLKNLTQNLREIMIRLDKEVQFCKNGVKINIPNTLWKAFGFLHRVRKYNTGPEPDDTNDDTIDDTPANQIDYAAAAKPGNAPSKNRK